MNNKRRDSIKINLNEYPKEIQALIINKLRANEEFLPQNNYAQNTSIHRSRKSVFHVSPLIPNHEKNKTLDYQ